MSIRVPARVTGLEAIPEGTSRIGAAIRNSTAERRKIASTPVATIDVIPVLQKMTEDNPDNMTALELEIAAQITTLRAAALGLQIPHQLLQDTPGPLSGTPVIINGKPTRLTCVAPISGPVIGPPELAQTLETARNATAIPAGLEILALG